jgi:hypothetical protein
VNFTSLVGITAGSSFVTERLPMYLSAASRELLG